MIADVGQDRFEEIDYETLRGASGANFGWDEWEGFAPNECDGRCAPGTTKPIFAYGVGDGCAVIGGYVVRDRRLRSLYRRYVFTDLCDGVLRSLAPRLGRVRSAQRTGLSVSQPSSFGEDTRGRLYVASLDGPGLPPGPAMRLFRDLLRCRAGGADASRRRLRAPDRRRSATARAA